MTQPESSPTPLHDLLVAKFEALLAECDLIATNEHTLDTMGAFFLAQGRKLLQETFEAKLQERVDQVETAAEAKQCSHCKKKLAITTKKRKT